jgi:hypothetical protein
MTLKTAILPGTNSVPKTANYNSHADHFELYLRYEILKRLLYLSVIFNLRYLVSASLATRLGVCRIR